MGFFKDFKDDFSEAVNDLVPGAEELDTEDTATDTLDEEIDVQSELSKLDGLLEQVTKESRRHTGRGGTGYSKTRKHSGGYSDNGNKRSSK